MTEANTIELKADDVVAGRYRICRRLGVGGMGTVYESQQITLDRKIALKVLRPELAGKEMAAKRFEREAKSASSIEHRNVVNILDFGHLETGELYYTMELLHGRDLSKVLKEEGALPWSRAGWIILQVVRAFAAIHDKGVVHRDLKPANCVLLDPKPGDDPDFVKILDFGIANLQDKTQATALTGASDIIGSAPYMAPEQVEGKEVDARTDIYSLGIMMYELLTGKVPFREQHIYKIMMQHLTEAPQPPRELVPEIPPEVEAIILRSIAKKPEDRYQSMAEIELDLSLFVEKPQASAVLQRSLPSASSADRSAMGSSAGRPVAGTRPGPTGTVAIPSSASGSSMRATRQEGPVAETTPRVGGSMGFNAQTFGEPQRRRGMLLPLVLVLLVFGGAIGLTLWLQRSEQGDEIAKKDETPGEDESGKQAGKKPAEAQEEEEEEGLQLLPPPEAPYDPFADPFGAPPLGGRTMQRPGTATAEGGEVPMEAVPLEKLLPPQSWTLEPGSIAGRILGEKDRPLAKAQVCAWIVDPAAPLELRRSPKCANVDRQGRFELREIKPSLYDISAFARGFVPLSLQARDGYPLAVEPGKRSEGVEMVLVPGGVEIRGTVKTTVGDPLASASVALVGSVRALTTTNPKGEFSLWGGDVGAGSVAVLAWTNGYTDVIAKGPATDPFALVLRRESKLIGKVVDPASGEPIENAKVRAGTQGGGIDPLVYTDAKGEFTINALPEGSYQPTARTDVAFGQAKKVIKLKESALSPEVVIEARTFVVEAPAKPVEPEPEPEPVPAGSTGSDDATAGGDETTGGGDGADGAKDGGDEGVPPPVPPVEPQPPEEGKPTPPKPVRTDKTIRRDAAMKIKGCGTDGQVEVTAQFVLDDGRLSLPKVKVTGNAGKDPAVKACVEKIVKRLRLLPRKDPDDFEPLKVTI